MILQAFYTVLREHKMGINSDMIVREISSRIGQDFNVKLYGCQLLLEFLSKFIIPTKEIEII